VDRAVSASIERELARAVAQDAPPAAALPAEQIPPLAFDLELDNAHRLPPDHPPWPRDVVSLSQRARALLVRIKPAVFDAIARHRLFAGHFVVADRRVAVDASGCYRVD
jgi:hypothetical protein